MRHRDVIVNLIPYNPTDVPMGHSPPKMEDVRAMCAVLTGPEFNQFTTVRHEMGQDISGACGQLALKKGPSVGNGGAGCGTGDIEDIGGVGNGAAGDDDAGLRQNAGSDRAGVAGGGGKAVEDGGKAVEGGGRRRAPAVDVGRRRPSFPAGRGVRVVCGDGGAGVPGVPSLAHGGGGRGALKSVTKVVYTCIPLRYKCWAIKRTKVPSCQ